MRSKKEEVITIKMYLKKEIKESVTLSLLIQNLFIGDVDVNAFFKTFDELLESHDPKDVSDFIMNPDNSCNIAIFGASVTGLNKINAYNGMGHYQNTVSSLGAAHSLSKTR